MKKALLLLAGIAAFAAPLQAQQVDGEKKLSFAFKEASIEAVLLYVSGATGWVFVQEAPCRGTITAYSRTDIPTSRCLEFLNAALRQHGLAIRNSARSGTPAAGDTLRVQELAKAAPADPPLYVGNDAREIPATEEVRIQVLPLKSASAADTAKDLAELIRKSLGDGGQVSVSAPSNSIILTGRSDGIRRVAEILAVIDRAASTRMSVSLVPLRYAEAGQAAKTLNDLLGRDPSRSEQGSSFGPGAMLRMLRMGPEPAAAAPSARDSVRIVAEPRMNAVLVTAPEDLMGGIDSLIRQMDCPAAALNVYVVPLKNTDATTAAGVLNSLLRDQARGAPASAASRAGTPIPGQSAGAAPAATAPGTRPTPASSPRR